MQLTLPSLALLPLLTAVALADNCYMQIQMSSTTTSRIKRITSTPDQGSLEQGSCQTNVNEDQPNGCNQLTTFSPVLGKVVGVDSSLPNVLEVYLGSDNFKTGWMAYAGQNYTFGNDPCGYSSTESVTGAVAEQVCTFTC